MSHDGNWRVSTKPARPWCRSWHPKNRCGAVISALEPSMFIHDCQWTSTLLLLTIYPSPQEQTHNKSGRPLASPESEAYEVMTGCRMRGKPIYFLCVCFWHKVVPYWGDDKDPAEPKFSKTINLWLTNKGTYVPTHPARDLYRSLNNGWFLKLTDLTDLWRLTN